jgi:Cu/Ag efflux pump CusA
MSEDTITWSEFREWQRLDERQIFFTHLAAYIVFNLFFIYLNLTKTPTIIWYVYPLGAWGCGVALHYITAIGMFDSIYEKRKSDVAGILKK